MKIGDLVKIRTCAMIDLGLEAGREAVGIVTKVNPPSIRCPSEEANVNVTGHGMIEDIPGRWLEVL